MSKNTGPKRRASRRPKKGSAAEKAFQMCKRGEVASVSVESHEGTITMSCPAPKKPFLRELAIEGTKALLSGARARSTLTRR